VTVPLSRARLGVSLVSKPHTTLDDYHNVYIHIIKCFFQNKRIGLVAANLVNFRAILANASSSTAESKRDKAEVRSVPRFKFTLARRRPSAVRCNSCRKAHTLCLQATRSPRLSNQKGRIPAFRLTAGPPTYWQQPLPSPHLQQPHELLPFCHQRWVTRRLEPPLKQQFLIFFLVRLQPVVSLSDTVLIKASSRKLQPNWIQGFQHDLLRMNGKKMGA
jgi:hypothetical protein